MIYEQSGKLSNGQTWSWQFGGSVDLFAKDNPANCVMVTYLHSGNDEVFEDELLDENFDPLFGGDKSLRREYVAVCWSCFLEEREIINGLIPDTIKTVAWNAIKQIREKDPNANHLLAEQFLAIHNAVLKAIKDKEELDDEEDWWLIGSVGEISNIVDKKLEDYLMAHGFDIDY